jgi:GxxExxY protein
MKVRVFGCAATKGFGPQIHTDENGLDPVTDSVIGAAFEVSNALGAGFLEKIYERALVRELRLRGVAVEAQVRYPVFYKGERLGEYVEDLVVGGSLLVELKCVERFASEHMAQCINCLKASRLRVGLLLNFQKPKVEWKRVVWG